MKILIACEYSGTVRDAFSALGHDATSCDILPTEKPGKHYQGDVTEILGDGWDIMIAHPPCTYLSVSGIHWNNRGRGWDQTEKALEFVQLLMNAPISRIAIENPISIISSRIKKPSQVIQPWMFGHMEQKATCLWLKNLPALRETNNVKAEMMKLPDKERQRIHYLPPSKDRWKLRSTTYQGIADAMAKQWSNPDYFELERSQLQAPQTFFDFCEIKLDITETLS